MKSEIKAALIGALVASIGTVVVGLLSYKTAVDTNITTLEAIREDNRLQYERKIKENNVITKSKANKNAAIIAADILIKLTNLETVFQVSTTIKTSDDESHIVAAISKATLLRNLSNSYLRDTRTNFDQILFGLPRDVVFLIAKFYEEYNQTKISLREVAEDLYGLSHDFKLLKTANINIPQKTINKIVSSQIDIIDKKIAIIALVIRNGYHAMAAIEKDVFNNNIQFTSYDEERKYWNSINQHIDKDSGLHKWIDEQQDKQSK